MPTNDNPINPNAWYFRAADKAAVPVIVSALAVAVVAAYQLFTM